MLKPKQKGQRFWYPLTRHPVARVLKLETYLGYLRNIPEGGVVLDYGSGDRPYEALLRTRFTRYLSADYVLTNAAHSARPDLPIVDGRVDLPDASVDCVVLTEVLEHVYEPGLALRELQRLLRPGGCLIGSVPFGRGEHEAPHDYYRYTSFALKRLLRDAGFVVRRVDYIGDLVGVLVTTLATTLDLLPRALRKLGLGILALPLTLLFRIPEFIYYGLLRLGLAPGKLAYFRQYPLGFTFFALKPDGHALADGVADELAVTDAVAPATSLPGPGLLGRWIPEASPLRARYRLLRRGLQNFLGSYVGSIPTPEKWVFLIGCYNSGTTLLHDILATHPAIGSMPDEGQFHQSVLVRPADVGLPRLWALRPELFHMDENSTGVNLERLKRQWGARLRHADRPVLIEKTPVNVARVRWLEKHFENAHFIAIVRNGYAVAEGIHRKAGHPLAQAAQQWARSNEIMLDELPGLQHAMVVRYEDLTTQTDATMRKVLAFLGLSDEGFPISGRAWKVHEQTAPIGNFNARSLEALTPAERAEIEAHAGDVLRRLGYL